MSDVHQITDGAFNFEFDQGRKRIWWEPSGAFNVENKNLDHTDDINFYTYESITLKVLAKKEAGTRDYVLDVVGYSDDKLLNYTPASGGFLQSPSGVWLNDNFVAAEGEYPVQSGYYSDSSSDWTLAGASLSEKEAYFEASGNDHYKLTQYPYVRSTDFEWYEVPLVVNDPAVRLGQPMDMSMSSKLENIYLDIFPLPSGASIAALELCVRYAPQAAMNLRTFGGNKLGPRRAGLSPAAMITGDEQLNTGSGYQPISRLEDLPHLYSSPDTIKTNYSRRWRGIEGTVRGPFDIDMFDFGYDHPTIDYPFLSGYFKFDSFGSENRYALSVDMGPSSPSGLGTLSGIHFPGEPEVYQNLGWRFSSGTLFGDHLPLYSGNYTSTDWTALSKGSTTFAGNPMYGKIADAFDRVVRISGEAGGQYIDFGNVDVSGGFAIFTRFTPDSNVSGTNYNLFDSGVIVSKWTTANNMDFALGYENGFLCGFAQDVDGNVIKVTDSHPYSGYQYPLNTILTYNDSGNHRLRLYADNEFASGDWNVLRATSAPFHKNATSENIILGYAGGSGVGMNMLVSEFGVSTYSSGVDTLYGFGTNIVASGADRTYKGVTADDFLRNSRVKYFDPNETADHNRYELWDRVNENTYYDWGIGDFKWCQFGIAFDQWQKRPNTEQIVFDIKHHGSGYSQLNDLPMPLAIDSGVAYHTQIENDFLRFHLSNVENSFYSVAKRITKNLPCGYNFAEDALVVDTVIEHRTGSGIKWESCEDIAPSGPRLIVSLYTKNKDPYWTSDEPNWGLINRRIHDIKPYSCLTKIESKFSYDDICEDRESWSAFPREPRLREFTETYFSQDVNDMFVQYDLVYPSGPAFESRLEFHSSHVRMEDANFNAVDTSGSMNMNVSGAFPKDARMSLNVGGFPRPASGIVPLNMNVPLPYDIFSAGAASGFVLNISGAVTEFSSLNLYIPPQSGYNYLNLNVGVGNPPPEDSGNMNLALPKVLGRIDSSEDQNPLTTPGGQRSTANVDIGGENIVVDGLASDFDTVVIVDNPESDDSTVQLSGGTLTITGNVSGGKLNATDIQNKIDALPELSAAGAESAGNGTAEVGEVGTVVTGNPNRNNLNGMPLTILNSEVSSGVDGPYLNLSTWSASPGWEGLLTQMNLLAFNNQKDISGGGVGGLVQDASASMQLLMFGRQGQRRTVKADIPLYINAPNIMDVDMPLYIHNPLVSAVDSGTLGLYTINIPVGSKGFGSTYGLWDGSNYGTGIEIEDNFRAALTVANEIRGVDLVGYGDCSGDSPSKANDKALITDCTIWRPETCNDGGIFRAKETYTNPDAINFSEQSELGTDFDSETFDAAEKGYKGNYYGIRKYTQLLPNTAYDVVMTIKTGSTQGIPVPRNFEEWEYGMCGPDWYADASGCCTEDCDQNIVFSGIKLVGDDSGVDGFDPELIVASGRQPHAKHGSKVKVKGNLMAVSAPDLNIPDFDPNRGIEDYVAGLGILDPGQVDVSGAGAVFLYQRGEDVAGKKANWTFIEQLMLPSGFRKDYIQTTKQNILNFDGLSISGQKWQIGQEGRRFGESIDMCNSGDRNTLVIGAPRAKWERTFADIPTSGITAATLVVADLFNYDEKKLKGVAGAAQRFNILWKYFSAPWEAGTPDEWYPQVSTKVMVLQLAKSTQDYPEVPTDQSSWFQHRYIPRLDDRDLLELIGGELVGEDASLSDKVAAAQPVIFDLQFSGVLSAFDTLFPLRDNVIYSGLPPIMGMFKEKTGSTAGALRYKDSNGDIQDLYDRIETYYEDWTYASGVRDLVQSITQRGHLNTIEGKSEDAYSTTSLLISNTFDSGRLSTTFTDTTLNRNFITSGVGQIWGDTHSQIRNQFQIPPASGGRVYIFEKERNDYNCIQVITSPADAEDYDLDDENGQGSWYAFTPNDRFGHSVSISDNSEIITIGNPFKATPATIYERNEDEIQRVYDNIRAYCVSGGYNDAVNHYDKITAASGEEIAKVSTYDHIQPATRFKYRNDANFWRRLPEPYQISFDYRYSDIAYVGTNKFIPGEFAPTSRLGWSTAVNEQGDICAFGAPTDSFNLFEDVNVYGTGLKQWASFVHAGAVRIFESRKYHTHNEIVEFGRFGNLDRAIHTEERQNGFYDKWDNIFASGKDGNSGPIPFRRMDFSEIEIPTTAGLCFINTPELDAASDEIVDNIKNWLALGDRNLVLVGNDPVYEENGVYKEGNDVLNKLLKKLDSRMRIFPARNGEYALKGTEDGECITDAEIADDLYNVTPVPAPAYSTGYTLEAGNMYGKGFGDIRIDLSQDGLEDYEEYFGCPEGKCCGDCGDQGPAIINDKCEFPLKHEGDLRAQWTEQCIKSTPRGCKVVSYAKNWPLEFNNFTPDCDDPPVPLFTKTGMEPVPVLTTAEHLPDTFWFRAATSGEECSYYPIYEWRLNPPVGSTTYFFESSNIDEAEFEIFEDENSNVEGTFNSFDFTGDFFDPDKKNGRDGLLQALGTSYYPEDEERTETRELSPFSILGLVESGKLDDGEYNNSRVYLMGTQWSEDDHSRGLDSATLNDDKNTEFYINMIRKDCVASPRGIQINGFTEHDSLADAYYTGADTSNNYTLGGKITLVCEEEGGYFKENQTIDDLNSSVDFAWIAQPETKASKSDMGKIRDWLNLGNKKLIITYNCALASHRQSMADNVNHLCSGVNITSKPWFIPSVGEYFETAKVISAYQRPDQGYEQRISTMTDSVSGCDNGYEFADTNYSFSTALSGVEFSPNTVGGTSDAFGDLNIDDLQIFVPISGGEDYERILWYDYPVTEQYTVYPTNRWKIDGDATIEFPTVQNSGYRLFVNWVSETDSEEFNICGDLDGACGNADPNPEDCQPIFGGDDFDEEGEGDDCGTPINLSRTARGDIQTRVIDFRAREDKITINLNTDLWNSIPRERVTDGVTPITPRLLSISGCFLPIGSETTITQTSGKVVVGWRKECEWIVSPAQSGVIPGISRPVSHLSSPYCSPDPYDDEDCRNEPFGETLIQDGPVIVAEEPEQFSAFGAGRRRSHIIVIADSTLIQGQCPNYRGLGASDTNVKFIRSLYPTRPEDYDNPVDDDFDFDSERSFGGTRNWRFVQKLRAPEVGSAAKYSAASGAAIPNMVFDKLWGGSGPGSDLSLYYDNEDYILDPTVTAGRPPEERNPEKIKQIKENFYNNALSEFGMYPRFSGDFLTIIPDNPTPPEYYNELLGEEAPILENRKEWIADAGIAGGMSDLMKINNTDYLDFDVYNSGCAGDLFGYSIDLSNGKLIVGTPFNGYYTEGAVSGVSGIVQWHEIENDPSLSGMRVAEDGGAGAAFIFDRTGSGENLIAELLPWQFTQKIKPSSLNVGIYDFRPSPEEALTAQRGVHFIDDPNVIISGAKQSDRFGMSVAIDCDMCVIGAPNHDFDTLHHHIYADSVTDQAYDVDFDQNGFGNGLNSAFQRKSFTAAYDIPKHSYYDLGSSGVRVDKFGNQSGMMVLNAGAVFNYRNELVDFPARRQEWTYAQKIVAQSGYEGRGRQRGVWTEAVIGVPPFPFVHQTSGNEFDNFGFSVTIDRIGRGDSDYTMVAGAPRHTWPVSGDHPTQDMRDAGAAFTFDAMLREQVESIPNSGSWIDAHVFGNKKYRFDQNKIARRVYQNTEGDSLSYQVSGVVSANDNGDVFLEVSGFDPSTKGFVAHRPYVYSVEFALHSPDVDQDSLSLFISGQPVGFSGDMNLSLLGSDRANVYNNMGMYNFGVSGIAEAGDFINQSGLPLIITAPSGPVTDILNLNVTSTQTTGVLPLRTRGF